MFYKQFTLLIQRYSSPVEGILISDAEKEEVILNGKLEWI